MNLSNVASTPLPGRGSPATRRLGRVALDQLLVPFLVVAILYGFANISSRYRLVPVLAGLVVGSFVLVLNGSSWLLAPLLLTEMTISNDRVPGLNVTLRLAGVLLAFGLSASLVMRLVKSADPRVRQVVLPALALVTISTSVNLLTSDLDYVGQYFRYMLSAFLALLVTGAVVRDRNDVKRVALIALAVIVVSSLAAIWQHLAYQSAPYGEVLYIKYVTSNGRATGLADSAVYLADDIPIVLVPLLGFLACGSSRPNPTRLLLAGAAFVCGVGMYFTNTRAAMLAVGAGVVTIAFFVTGIRRVLILSAIAGIVLMYQLLHGAGAIQKRYYSTTDTSAQSHLALWIVDLGVAMSNPIIGVGHQNFETVSAEYANQASVNVGSVGAIGNEPPHNDFLGIWASWGIAALAAYLALLRGTLANFARAAKSPDPLVRGLAVGCVAGTVAYAVNSAFHNLMDTSTILWMYAGFSVALSLLAPKPASGRLLRGRPRARRAIGVQGRWLLWE